MTWSAADFHPMVFSLLESREGQMVPLTISEFQPQPLPAGLMTTPADQLFPKARDASAALAGLLLMCGHWEMSHQVSQDISNREGSYWHAIAHRMEPDFGNAGYWFRRVGEHPIYAALQTGANALLAESDFGWHLKERWDSLLFLKWCERAKTLSHREKLSKICEIHSAECNLLFAWCALQTKDF